MTSRARVQCPDVFKQSFGFEPTTRNIQDSHWSSPLGGYTMGWENYWRLAEVHMTLHSQLIFTTQRPTIHTLSLNPPSNDLLVAPPHHPIPAYPNLGAWASSAFNTRGDVLPDAGVLGAAIVAHLVSKSKQKLCREKGDQNFQISALYQRTSNGDQNASIVMGSQIEFKDDQGMIKTVKAKFPRQASLEIVDQEGTFWTGSCREK
ncbi:uncharacterized protein F5147DRAFT_763935 [Suillus discolor]|uniref:Uncharacterized protein n=1 Tax=Suillus discolor TaxID=1912936 RepID=A0A9P7EXP7_9AGAM|nr:uncharacterized protein F5147DRAFT_763935 [Suillus discolor]KAG2094023.1 hypothetical protein F5147DRAFT_763935 [Suillus discolor]